MRSLTSCRSAGSAPHGSVRLTISSARAYGVGWKMPLTHRQNLAASTADEERARILGDASSAGDCRRASPTPRKSRSNSLSSWASNNRDRVIQECWHGAAGQMLAAKGNFKDAVPELEEDQDHPETLFLLAESL